MGCHLWSLWKLSKQSLRPWPNHECINSSQHEHKILRIMLPWHICTNLWTIHLPVMWRWKLRNHHRSNFMYKLLQPWRIHITRWLRHLCCGHVQRKLRVAHCYHVMQLQRGVQIGALGCSFVPKQSSGFSVCVSYLQKVLLLLWPVRRLGCLPGQH